VLEVLLRVEAEAGPAAIWVVMFCATVVAAFVVFIGIALWATLHPSKPDPEQQKICYQVFRDLLELFLRGKHR
jgi:hypothetical protein